MADKPIDPESAAYAALILAESIFNAMVSGGLIPRPTALDVLSRMVAKATSRGSPGAALELQHLRDEIAAKSAN